MGLSCIVFYFLMTVCYIANLLNDHILFLLRYYSHGALLQSHMVCMVKIDIINETFVLVNGVIDD